MYPFIPGDLVKLMIASLVVGADGAMVDYRERARHQPLGEERPGVALTKLRARRYL